MLRIAMLDDESEYLELAKGAFQASFQSLGDQVDIKTFSSGKVFLLSLEELNYDLICLDIMMDEISGIEVAKNIREKDKNVPIVFISSNENNVFSCFNYNPIGFVRKNNFLPDTLTVIRHYLKDVLPNLKKSVKLNVKSHGENYLINISDIVYIEGNHNYQNLYLKGDAPKIEVRKPISEFETQLSQYGFIRIHKGYLVNYQYIRKFTSTDVVLLNGRALPISRQTRDEIIQKYMDLTKDCLQ